MKRTSVLSLLAAVLIGGTIVFSIESALVGSGGVAIVPPVTLGPALVVLAAALLVTAWPVRKAARGERRIDHRHATSVLGFAKASSIVGALLGGGALGALTFFASRPVVVSEPLLPAAILGAGALVQLIAGLVAESWCVLPPDDEEPASPAAPDPA